MTNTKNLLKSAIADAKLVRETALENAKMALTEAFTPKLQAMLSNRIAEDEDLDNEVPAEEAPVADEVPAEEAPVTDEAPAEEAPAEEAPAETGEEEDLDLESIIRELDGEVNDEAPVEDEQPMENVVQEGDEEEETDLDEIIASLSESDADAQALDGLPKNESAKVKALTKDLSEAMKTIKVLQSSLQEVNLLNAKLLYVNKLFKAANMNEGQKIKIIETFDRTKTVREAKLVFSTLSEHIRSMKNVKKSTPVLHTVKKQIKEGTASKVISATKKVNLDEGFDVATKARFQKFANIKTK